VSFKTDPGGLATKASIKVSSRASTWNTRLSQLLIGNKDIIICTFSLPKTDEYLGRLLQKRSNGVTIIANSKFGKQARMLKAQYPNLRIFLSPTVHAKLALVSPNIVWMSSENFVHSRNFENTIGIHSVPVYKYLIQQLQDNDLFAPETEVRP